MPALEDYTLARLRDDVLDEFGLSKADAELRARADLKINDAQVWISNFRQDWPWRVSDLVADLAPFSTSTKLTISKGSTGATVTGAIPPQRSIILAPGTSGGTFGYLVTASDSLASTITIQNQWLGNDLADEVVTVAHGWSKLPDDFHSLKHLAGLDGSTDVLLSYRDPLGFDILKRKQDLVGNQRYLYTVKPDPLAQEDNKYLALYPYVTERLSLIGSYWRSVPKLVDDDDVPILPRDGRVVLLHVAYWMMAVSLKAEPSQQGFYKQQADQSLSLMADHFQLANPPQGLRQSEATFGPPEFPPGYPSIRENLV